VPSDPTARIDADLTVGQLDDPRVLSLFGLQRAVSREARD